MDRDFRRFLCEIICRPVMIAVPMFFILALHDLGYSFLYLKCCGSYSVSVTVTLKTVFWFSMLPVLSIMAFMKLRWQIIHGLFIMLIIIPLLFWGGGYIMLRLMLSIYWITGCIILLTLKYLWYPRVLILFRAA